MNKQKEFIYATNDNQTGPEKKPGLRPEAYQVYMIRDGGTVFYVGQVQNTYNRLLSHLGIDERGEASPIGLFIRENAPESGAWIFEQYTLEECRSYVEQYRATFSSEIQAFYTATGNHYDVDDAEESLIKIHRPHFNIAMNTNPAPLPSHYKTSLRRAGNRKADELAALYGIE